MNFQKRDLTFISNSSFILSILASKFGVCVYYFLNIKLEKFRRKKTTYGFFMIYLVLDDIVKKEMKKNKPSSLIVMILQCIKDLCLKLFS